MLDIKDATTPASEFLFDDELPESEIVIPEVGAEVYEDTIATTELRDEGMPGTVASEEGRVEPATIEEATEPKSEPITRTVYTEEKIIRKISGDHVTEESQHTELSDETVRGENRRVEKTEEVTEPTYRSVFDVVDEEERKAADKNTDPKNQDETKQESDNANAIFGSDSESASETEETKEEAAKPAYESKPETKPMSESKKESKSEPETKEENAKAIFEDRTESETKSETESEPKSETKASEPETKEETKSETKHEAKAEPKREVKEKSKAKEKAHEPKEDTKPAYESKSEPKEETREETVTRTHAFITTDDGEVHEIVEERREEPVEREVDYVPAEPHVDVVPQRASKIDTIPMTKDGRVKHEEPMIPTLPPIAAKGVTERAAKASAPFVLPATAGGLGMMEKNPAYAKTENESSFERALNAASDIPVAPVISRGADQPAVAPVAAPVNTSESSDVFMANADVNITFGNMDSTPVFAAVPELIEEPEAEEEVVTPSEPEIPEEPETEVEPEVEEPEIEAEPEIEEPEIEEEPEVEPEVEPEAEPEEPVAVVVEEPVIDEPIADEPEEAPVFTTAEKADELMTDDEAEEHIEMIEDKSGNGRRGKVHAVNLDTICDHFNDGDTVTLDSLKAKRLAPQNAGRLKVLARGTMNKKLTLEADSFSLQAVKMITLAGGHAEQYK